MELPSYAKMQEEATAESVDLPGLKVAVLRNIVLEPILPIYQYCAARIGYRAAVEFGGYDAALQEAIGNISALLGPDTDCVVVHLKLEALSEVITRRVSSAVAAVVADECERVLSYCSGVIEGVRAHTDALILWHGFETPAHPSLGILSGQREDSETNSVRRLNRELRRTVKSHESAYFVDLDLCLARVGYPDYYDLRFWQRNRAPYGLKGMMEIAVEDFKHIAWIKGKHRKCLVVDCDGTIWGGVVGEDGPMGVALGDDYPGRAYVEFQREIVSLCERGVLVAVNSKNNEADVADVFETNPWMQLTTEHIVSWRVNWQDKASNLCEIAEELNIGLDSMVFMDDNPREADHVRTALPEVEVINLPEGKPFLFRDLLASCGYFDVLSVSAEDKRRAGMYRAESARRRARPEHLELGDYLRSLEMVARVCLVDEASVPRVAQLTMRTNQFNLTTKRYSEGDIRRLSDADSSDVLYLQLEDRFGPLGIVAVAVLTYRGQTAHIDSFLMSCRVIGRGVEEVLIGQVVRQCILKGCKTVTADCVRTRKNEIVEEFYPSNGFQTEWEDTSPDGEEARHYSCELERFQLVGAGYLARLVSEIEGAVADEC
ncbi:HAD-IIIC family phosphatase [Candidatus Latescibacterota bacterium]